MVVEMKGYTVMMIKAKLRGILLRNQSPHFLWRLAMDYKHPSIAERHYIQVVRKMGKSLSKIASEPERSPCAISRESNETQACGLPSLAGGPHGSRTS